MNQNPLKVGSALCRASVCAVALSSMALGLQLNAFGQDSDAALKSGQSAKPLVAKTTSVKAVAVSLTPAEEAAALAFAKQHHPELAKLLEQLRSKSTSGFSRGTREIHQAAQRLERLRDKQPARFEAELKNWQLDSEIRLLTAKWTVSQDEKLVAKIQALLRSRQVAKIDRQKAERSRLAERLQQLDAQIGMGTEELEADLAAEWQQLAKRSTATAKARKNRPKAGANEAKTDKADGAASNKKAEND